MKEKKPGLKKGMVLLYQKQNQKQANTCGMTDLENLCFATTNVVTNTAITIIRTLHPYSERIFATSQCVTSDY